LIAELDRGAQVKSLRASRESFGDWSPLQTS